MPQLLCRHNCNSSMQFEGLSLFPLVSKCHGNVPVVTLLLAPSLHPNCFSPSGGIDASRDTRRWCHLLIPSASRGPSWVVTKWFCPSHLRGVPAVSLVITRSQLAMIAAVSRKSQVSLIWSWQLTKWFLKEQLWAAHSQSPWVRVELPLFFLR